MSPSRLAANGPLPLAPLDIACNLPLGRVTKPARDEQLDRSDRSARELIEGAIAMAVRAGPIVVSFSGGRDSSAILAIATRVCRREGLPDPIAVSMELPGSEAADEREWQDIVLQHLGLHGDRLLWTSEMDLCGPVATDLGRRLGLMWPSNAHLHDPILRAYPGTTLITGIGGDEVLSEFEPRLAARTIGTVRSFTPRGAAAIGESVLLRRRATRRVGQPHLPWLSAQGSREFEERWLEGVAGPHTGYPGAIAMLSRSRYQAHAKNTFDVLARDRGARALHPFQLNRVQKALGREAGRSGFVSRSQAMSHLVGDLLPSPVLERGTKATFDDVLWGAISADRRDDPAVMAALVDDAELGPLIEASELHEAWSYVRPHFASSLLLQAGHLATL